MLRSRAAPRPNVPTQSPPLAVHRRRSDVSSQELHGWPIRGTPHAPEAVHADPYRISVSNHQVADARKRDPHGPRPNEPMLGRIEPERNQAILLRETSHQSPRDPVYRNGGPPPRFSHLKTDDGKAHRAEPIAPLGRDQQCDGLAVAAEQNLAIA